MYVINYDALRLPLEDDPRGRIRQRPPKKPRRKIHRVKLRKLRVMFADVVPLVMAEVSADVTLPAIGDEVHIAGYAYTVKNRVWTLKPYTVAIYVSPR